MPAVFGESARAERDEHKARKKIRRTGKWRRIAAPGFAEKIALPLCYAEGSVFLTSLLRVAASRVPRAISYGVTTAKMRRRTRNRSEDWPLQKVVDASCWGAMR